MDDDEENIVLTSNPKKIKKIKKNKTNKKIKNKFKRKIILIIVVITFILILFILFLILKKKFKSKIDNNVIATKSKGTNINAISFEIKDELKDDFNFSEAQKLIEIQEKTVYTSFPNYEREIKKLKFISKDILNDTKKKRIYITMSLNVKALYQTLVTMTSVLENCNKDKTIISFYILVSFNFNSKHYNILKSVKQKYPKNTEITFYNMGFMFMNNRNIKYNYQYATNYRLAIPEILKESDRVIHLDCDVLVYQDLTEMFELPFNDNYIMGFIDVGADQMDHLKIHSTIVISAGVTLYNLKKIREDSLTKQFFEFLYDKTKKKNYPDQDAINYVCYPKIGFLPFKYGLYGFYDLDHVKAEYLSRIRLKIDINEFEKAMKNPAILHMSFCIPKFYSKKSLYAHTKIKCSKPRQDFYYFANKTYYYSTIKRLYYYK